MESEAKAITLSPEQVTELARRIRKLRHDVNNNLTLIISAGELLRRRPELAERMATTITEQVGKIEAAMRHFSNEADGFLGVQTP